MADNTSGTSQSKASAKSTPATKATAKKAPATKAPVKKAPAKNTTAKKAPATKTTAKKAPAKRAPATKTTAKKTPAKKPSAVASAADRAGGERARRSSTPLLTGPSARIAATPTPAAARASRARPKKAPAPPRTPNLRIVPGPDGAPPAARRTPAASSRTASSAKRSAPVRSTAARAPEVPAVSAERADESESGQTIVPGVSELLSVLTSAGQMTSRTLGHAAGAAAGEEWEGRFKEAVEFLQRRVRGDYAVDDFGFDQDFTTHTVFPLLRLLKEKWFRVEVRGIENIPDEGGALLVSNHSGTIAIDAIVTQLAIHDEHPTKRSLRMLGADLVFQLPVVGDFARKTGATLASNADAERLLRGGELVGVWPEGFKGVGKPFRERYKLQRFGRGGFVSAAIRSEVPIIPCSVVGAEEVYPMIGNMKTVARLFGAPYAPITPFFPLLGPLGLIPLPSKWIIEFGPPIDTASLGSAAADDPMLVFDLTDQVRETIQQTLYSVLVTRRSVFF